MDENSTICSDGELKKGADDQEVNSLENLSINHSIDIIQDADQT